MLTLGPLAFAVAWALIALAGLPVLWWLLRIIPPAPRRVAFPAIRLLQGLRPREDTPHHTPWWLLLLRLVIAALVILAVSRPLFPSGTAIPEGGPIVLVIDDGWAAGRDFESRRQRALRILDQAERENRPVALLTTAARRPGEAREIELAPAARVKAAVGALTPRPWPIDARSAGDLLDRLTPAHGAVAVWIRTDEAAPGAAELAARLQRLGRLVVIDAASGGPVWLGSPEAAPDALTTTVRRLPGGIEAPVAVRAVTEDDRVLARVAGTFAAGAEQTTLSVALPTELRNEVARLEVEGESTAAATFLVDERFRRRPVGLLSAREFEGAQPLLDELYYLDRALEPFTEIRRGDLASLLDRELAVLVMADVGTLPFGQRERIDAWIRDGGVAVRFAGPRLAAAGVEKGGLGPDDLVPVRLRRGDRTLGGALSWSRPATLAPFAEDSPFRGVGVPTDVTVSRQVLAEPAIDLGEKTWARLADGTPIVTADRRGGGWLVLVHTTANADWSNLPLSGLFVEMLRRLVALSQGVGGASERAMPALSSLDGFGRLGPVPAGADALPPAAARTGPLAVGPRHPPGFYGNDSAREALNLGPTLTGLGVRAAPPAGAEVQALDVGGDRELQGWLLAVALLLALLDTLVALLMRGLLPLARTAAGALLLAAAVASGPGGAQAQELDATPTDPERFALEASTETRLAYVMTGDSWVDGISRDGLASLSETLTRRTAVEPASPYGLDLERDELAFFPLLYWPITDTQGRLSEKAAARVNAYMRNGGVILFDTRDRYQIVTPGARGGPGLQRLIEISRDLEIPPLAPVAPDHVLTRTFYLLQEFPGRYAGGTVWLEDGAGNPGTEVSPVLIGSHDWAGAWARDGVGRFRFPVVPGGEIQREMAFRFGINLVMYALTGNYKADQVHVPSILERLGQ
ncbi:double-region [Thalassobaculum fulvum]|uniref:Double-region n=1 Tax=Thalassobaculum fulvum TaxID=1633335 RepID=A0A918XXK2_9PROT|nr:DUF4159 domain-containing protein [Thalassobaculum fulvum]GHD62915.1 double-region [Thalassobaculum fulvum]